MAALAGLAACLILLCALAVLCALVLGPGACVVLALVLALTPGCCAWCFYWLDQREAHARQVRGPLQVFDKGDR